MQALGARGHGLHFTAAAEGGGQPARLVAARLPRLRAMAPEADRVVQATDAATEDVRDTHCFRLKGVCLTARSAVRLLSDQ